MSRDTQIGLLLAVGFLALVGGVLYYRIEHPDDLDQFWNGADQVAQATPPQPTALDAPTPPATGDLAAAPTSAAPPALTSPPPLTEAKPETGVTTGSVVLAGAAAASSGTLRAPEAAAGSDIRFNVDPHLTGPAATKPEEPKSAMPPSPALALTAPKQDPPTPSLTAPDSRPAPTKPDDKPNTTTRQSFPEMTGPPSATAAGTNSAVSTPSPAPLGLNTSPMGVPTNPKDEQPATAADIKPSPSAPLPTNVPGLGLSTTPAPSPPSSPPALAGSTASETKPAGLPSPPSAPLASSAPAKPDESKPQASPTTTPGVTVPTFPIPGMSQELPKPDDLKGPGSVTTNNASGDPKPAPPVGTSTPPTSATPANASSPDSPLAEPGESTSRISADGRYREYTVPKATLGRPVPESVSVQNERRWADGSGAPVSVVPSGAEVRGDTTSHSGVGNSTIAAGERRVVRDSLIPWEYAMKGETFSSLSQRLYGNTDYAAAMAAYNHDEGFVEGDQPETNKMVAKPNREILDLKYAHLIRPASRPAVARAPGASPAARAVVNTRNDSPGVAAADLPVYRVGKGEQLFEVARKTLGDGYRWSEIYALNKDQLRDSTELRADMLLRLPGDAKLDGPKAR